MAHGAGGKATADADRGRCSRPRSGSSELGRRRRLRRRRRRAHDRQLRRQAAALPGRLDRRARRQRHVNDLAVAGRAAARAQPRADPRGGPRRRRAARRGRGDRRARRAPPGVRIVAGDTKVVERGHADGMYICTTGVGRARPARRALAGARCGPATGSSSRARSASTARRSCSPAASSSSTPTIESDTRSLWPAVDALLEAAGPALRCLRDATRGGVASVLNELARAVRRGDASCARRPCRSTRRSRARRRSWGSTRCTSPTRACSSPSWPPSPRTPRLRRCERSAGCERAAVIGEVQDGAAGMVLVETRLRRPAGDGPARRRPAAADLLRGAVMAATEFVPNQAKTEAITAHVLWMTVGLSAARATRVGDDLAPPTRASRTSSPARSPACRRSSCTTTVLAFEIRRRVHAGLVRRRGRASSTRSC